MLHAMSCDVRAEILRFDAGLPIERAATPPASWYREPEVLLLEQRAVFGDDWIAVGHGDELCRPGDQLAGEAAGLPVLLVRGADGLLRGFHNACRHHGTLLVGERCRADAIRCPYHGWTYALDGGLATAPRMAGVQGFQRADHGLRPLACTEALGLVFVHLAGVAGSPGDGAALPGGTPVVDERSHPLPDEVRLLDRRLAAFGGGRLQWAERRRYPLACNWKVFVDNYLDGGYHVEHMHPALAGLLDLEGYRTEVHGRLSIQSCAGAAGDHRLGSSALYAFVHPNLMLNRYGRVLDVNRVLPRGPEACEVIIDWAFEEGVSAEEQATCLAQSEVVQQEDVAICEAVQRGMASPGYGAGCYAPRLEQGAHAFHRELARQLRGGRGAGAQGDFAGGRGAEAQGDFAG